GGDGLGAAEVLLEVVVGPSVAAPSRGHGRGDGLGSVVVGGEGVGGHGAGGAVADEASVLEGEGDEGDGLFILAHGVHEALVGVVGGAAGGTGGAGRGGGGGTGGRLDHAGVDVDGVLLGADGLGEAAGEGGAGLRVEEFVGDAQGVGVVGELVVVGLDVFLLLVEAEDRGGE